jgi:hypothetical protein
MNLSFGYGWQGRVCRPSACSTPVTILLSRAFRQVGSSDERICLTYQMNRSGSHNFVL